MKQLDIMHDNENLGWCRPYRAIIDGVEYLAVYENMKFTVLAIGKKETYSPTTEQIKKFACAMFPEDQRDWYDKDDERTILLNTEECGRTECPFRNVCDAMQEDVGDDTFFFPNEEYVSSWFGSGYPVCLTEDDVRELARGWDRPFCELMSELHEATTAEIAEYGI